MLLSLGIFATTTVLAATAQPRYYAYEAVEDEHGVIAPWYTGLNGQWDFRVRMAAETLKRYPWTEPGKAASVVPHYVFNGTWSISPDGVISIPELSDWDNGDLGQRAAYVLAGLVDYYRYSGDPAAIAHLSLMADTLLDHCLTPADHPWPKFLISVPVKGEPYGQCDPTGFIQLDIVAEVGVALVKAYKLVGTECWLDAAKHWADLLAEKRHRTPGAPLWGRYANPGHVPFWDDHMTGGIAFLLVFFDELIGMGYTGRNNALVEARDAGRAWLRDVLLSKWTVDDTWGRNYWDWGNPVQAENVTEFVARYLIEHPDVFPNWKQDARNILSLFLNRTSVCPSSNGDTYSGAWAYPESSGCCGRSLWYGPLELAPVWAQYGVVAQSPWAFEIARRKAILATYDGHESGVVEDNLDGGQIVAGGWFKIAHPMALKHVLNAIAWMPEICGANRENHIVRTDSVVTHVEYGAGRVAYTVYDSPEGGMDVLRLAFKPISVTANGQALFLRDALTENGYNLQTLPNGDCIITLRRDGCKEVVITGEDAQRQVSEDQIKWTGDWSDIDGLRMAAEAGAEVSFTFTGNLVRILGRAAPDGGLADVYLNGVKQQVPVDCWIPTAPRDLQTLYYRNGLPQGEHTVRVVARGAGNPRSEGARVYISQALFSDAIGLTGHGEGGGPTDTQRMIFGYTGREDYVDTEGHAWRPGTEFVARKGLGADIVQLAWWTGRTRFQIDNTPDPELYRYGVHAGEFWVNVTVAPGVYYARLKFAENRMIPPPERAVTVVINGIEMVKDMDIAATAGADNKGIPAPHPLLELDAATRAGRHNTAVDLVINDIEPANGIIEIRLKNEHGGESVLQALEVGPGNGGAGAEPVTLQALELSVNKDGNLLQNPDFEFGVTGAVGFLGMCATSPGWQCLFSGPGKSYVWAESGFAVHPDWGLPEYHYGEEALRTHTDGQGHTVVYQEVPVEPVTAYRASVWVKAADLHGQGFGAHPGDSAGIRIQELDHAGTIIVDHPKAETRKAGGYTELQLLFTTHEAAARVRFILDTIIACHYEQGHVTYDDCSLVMQKK